VGGPAIVTLPYQCLPIYRDKPQLDGFFILSDNALSLQNRESKDQPIPPSDAGHLLSPAAEYFPAQCWAVRHRRVTGQRLASRGNGRFGDQRGNVAAFEELAPPR